MQGEQYSLVTLTGEDIDRLIEERDDARTQAEALGAEVQVLRGALIELFDYTVRLEGASSAWFATRSYARRPEVADDLGDRIKALLSTEPGVRGRALVEAGNRMAEAIRGFGGHSVRAHARRELDEAARAWIAALGAAGDGGEG